MRPSEGATAAKTETDSRSTRRRDMRSDAWWGPTAFGATDAAEASFVLRQYENRSLLFYWSRGDRRLNGALAKFLYTAPVLLDSLWDGWDAHHFAPPMAIEQAVHGAVIDLVSQARRHSPAEFPLSVQFLRSGQVRRTALRSAVLLPASDRHHDGLPFRAFQAQ